MSLLSYSAGYIKLFSSMVVKPSMLSTVDAVVNKINQGKLRYQNLEKQTGVPWFFIGVLHYMEASCSFNHHLHNGDPLNAKTVQVPKGRPIVWKPPYVWEASALDALKYKGLDKIKDWSLPQMLYLFESYNGFGYRRSSININSPYLWSFSNHYTKGKYIADRKYSSTTVSKQVGAAVILHRVMEKNNLLSKFVQAAAGGLGLLLVGLSFFF